MKRTLISILNYNGTNDTIECINSFYKYEDKKDYMIVIWDNASSNDNYSVLEEYIKSINNSIIIDADEYMACNGDLSVYDLILVKSKINYGFAIANNKVIEPYINRFDYYILLNNDTEFKTDTTKKCIAYLDKKRTVGVLSTSINYYDNQDQIWSAGGKLLFGWRKYYEDKYIERQKRKGRNVIRVDFITGCYMIVRNDVLVNHGLLSDKFFFGEEDYNFCMRMKKAKVNLCVRIDLKMFHKVGSSSSKKANTKRAYGFLLVYYLNRFIDMKEFYSPLLWRIWRIVSWPICFRMAFKYSNYSVRRTFEFLRLLYRLSRKNENVNKKVFDEIMNGRVI